MTPRSPARWTHFRKSKRRDMAEERTCESNQSRTRQARSSAASLRVADSAGGLASIDEDADASCRGPRALKCEPCASRTLSRYPEEGWRLEVADLRDVSQLAGSVGVGLILSMGDRAKSAAEAGHHRAGPPCRGWRLTGRWRDELSSRITRNGPELAKPTGGAHRVLSSVYGLGSFVAQSSPSLIRLIS